IIKDTPEKILKRFEHITFEGHCTNDELIEVEGHYNISQMQMRSDGKTYVKIYGEFKEAPKLGSMSFTKTNVDLEDVYLYLFGGGEIIV
ncbi:MAG: hypothetical protein GXY87_06120, partial [Tissierellia bacterium]|nr:hypothetical protein [Tissierellia bacterium]